MTQTDLLFTGQRDEPGDAAGLGLYNYKARFYSTLTGRFVSADSIVQSATDPQMLNRFSYVRDNPLRFVDPTGNCAPGIGSCPEGDEEGNAAAQAAREESHAEALNACASDLAACLWWSSGGDWETFIYTVASYYGVHPLLLAAIVLNEMQSRNWVDKWGEGMPYDYHIDPVLGMGWAEPKYAASFGIAQIQGFTALLLESPWVDASGASHGPLVPPSGSWDGTVDRLKNPRWAIIYAAAYLSYLNAAVVERRGDFAHLIVAYRFGPEGYSSWLRQGGCNTCGKESPQQIAKVMALVQEPVNPVRALATDLRGR